MATTERICECLREFLLRRLEIEDVDPADIPFDLDLFESKTIDSVDALEVFLGFEEEYQVVLPEEVEDLRDFASLRLMAAFLERELPPSEIERLFGE